MSINSKPQSCRSKAPLKAQTAESRFTLGRIPAYTLVVLIVMAAAQLLCYYLTRLALPRLTLHILTGPLDARIPFSPPWVTVYFLSFPFWICTALWFLRESRYLNYSRHLIGSSAAIGGTGFLAARELIERYDGWNFFTLTEDLEFTSRVVTDGYRIAFCREAELYDEQPIDLRTSWRQRMRWTRGYLQTMRKYGKALFLGVFRKDSPQRFACYDLLMNTIPPIVLGVVGLFLNVGKFFFVMGQGAAPDELVLPILQAIGSGYLMMFLMGALTVISEWKHIHAATGKKLLYMLTFPLFMFTFMPISIQALFCKVQWKPIRHTRALSRAAIEGK